MTGHPRLPIALLLKRLRAEARLSQTELANRVNSISGATLTRWDISRYERGERIPTVHLSALALALDVDPCALDEAVAITQAIRRGRIADLDGDALGMVRTPDDEERLILAARLPSRLDSSVVSDLSRTLASQRRIEDVIGSAAIVESATGQLRLILRLLRETRGPLAGALAATASEASQFSGWLHTATGRHDTASDLYDQALRLGLQAGNDDLAATALSMRGHLAWVTGDIGSMAALSEAAAEMATATGTRAISTQQHGRALAILGDRQGALRAMGQAEEELSTGSSGDDPDSLYFYGPELLSMQRGLVLAYLAEAPAAYLAAANTVSAGIQALPISIRDSEWVAWYRVRAAGSLAAAGEIDGAAEGLRTAHCIVSAAEGGKTYCEMVKVFDAMKARWPTHPAVRALADQIAHP